MQPINFMKSWVQAPSEINRSILIQSRPILLRYPFPAWRLKNLTSKYESNRPIPLPAAHQYQPPKPKYLHRAAFPPSRIESSTLRDHSLDTEKKIVPYRICSISNLRRAESKWHWLPPPPFLITRCWRISFLLLFLPWDLDFWFLRFF